MLDFIVIQMSRVNREKGYWIGYDSTHSLHGGQSCEFESSDFPVIYRGTIRWR